MSPKLPSLTVDNRRTGFFERAEFDAVLAYLPDDLKPVFTFAYLTGWRTRSEVLRLEWRHVDFERGVSLD